MKINENLRNSTSTYLLFHAKLIILVTFSRNSHHLDNFFTQKSSFWQLFHTKVVISASFSRKFRHFGDFFMQKSTFWQLFHAKVAILVALWGSCGLINSKYTFFRRFFKFQGATGTPDFHGFSQIFLDCPRLSQMFINCHRFSLILFDFPRLSQIFIDFL